MNEPRMMLDKHAAVMDVAATITNLTECQKLKLYHN